MLNVYSMKFRLVALGIALATIGILVRQFIALPMVQEHVGALAAAHQFATASYVARDVDHAVTSRLALIDRFAHDLTHQLARQPETLAAWIRERQRINPAFNGGLLAVRPDGRGVIAEYPAVTGRRDVSYATADWLLAALRDNKGGVAKPWRDPVTGEPIVVFAAPVRDGAGRVVTVLAGLAMLSAPGFLDRVQETKLGETGGLLVASPSDQVVVMSSDPSMILAPMSKLGITLRHDAAMAGYRGTGIAVNAEGIEELSAMVAVPSTGWVVVARMPTREAFRTVSVLRGFIHQSSVVLLVTVVALMMLALSRILRPLTDAARAMRDMADGRRKLEPLRVARDDEVGNLVSGFNVLVEKLSKEEASRAATEERLKFLAHHDALTGLFNRAVLEDRLEQCLARAERDGSQLALLFCDLDDFKAINDRYGHDAGDAVLREVAKRLADGRRQTDTVARLGGDEFVILLTGLKDAHAVSGFVAEQCLASIAEPFMLEGKPVTVGISIGIAVHAGPLVAPSYLIAQADIAMYQVKRQGKQGYFFMREIYNDGDLTRFESEDNAPAAARSSAA